MVSLIHHNRFLKSISNNSETVAKTLYKKFSELPLNCFSYTNSSLCLRSRLVKETRFVERPMLDHRLMRLFTTSHIGNPMKTIDGPTCQTKSYTGLEAEFYDLLRGKAPEEEVDFYRQLIKEKGGTALELGSGTGRLLLPLLKAGLSVEGIEGSKDMMEICRREASNQGLKPVLHHSLMHNFKISKTYDTVFAEGGTFMLLTDRNEAFLALKNIQEHLKKEGQAIIELFLPLEDIKKPNASLWNLHKTSVRPKDQAFIFCSRSSKCDVLEQLRTDWTKYEVFKEGRLVQSQLVVSGLRWYSKYEFWLMLEKVGFKSIEMMNLKMRQGADEETTMVFKAIKD